MGMKKRECVRGDFEKIDQEDSGKTRYCCAQCGIIIEC